MNILVTGGAGVIIADYVALVSLCDIDHFILCKSLKYDLIMGTEYLNVRGKICDY